MAASRIRPSKYRHVFGTEFQAAEQYRDIRHGTFGIDGSPLKGTADHFAVAYPGITGAVCVVSLSQRGALDHEQPPLLIHPGKEEVLDANFGRTQPLLFATSHGNGDVLLWDIPADGVKGVGTAPSAVIEAHPGKRVTIVDWHPLASNVLFTADSTKSSKIFDVATQEVIAELPNPYKGLISSVTWSGSGNLLATYAKDKKLRLFDPRANAAIAEVEDHSGVKGGSVIWCNNIDRVFTVGHDRSQNRCYSLWDPRNMSAKVTGASLDCSSSSLIPLLDQDTGVLFMGSRGDGTIRIYELTSDGVHSLNEFKSVDPTAALVALPKTSCNAEKNEIFRVLKLVPSKNIVLPIRFEIPRVDTGIFQEDLYPPTWDGKPSMTAAEWKSGANTPANTIDLRPQ